MTLLPPIRILLVNQSYVPDRGASGQLLGDLFSGLSEKGGEITVVAAPPTYTDEDLEWFRMETRPGLEIRRVGMDRFKGRKSLFNRAAGYVGFLWSAFWEVRRLTKEKSFDVIATASNPPFVGLIGAWYGLHRGIPYVYMLHDLHPDSLLRAGHVSLPLWVRWVWERLNRYIFNGAQQIVVMGDAMKAYLESEKGVPVRKIRVIHQWAHPELVPADKYNDFRRQLGIRENELMVLYFGNMGMAQNLDWLLKVADQLREQPIHFVFVGHGTMKLELERVSQQLELRNVRFLPYQPQERLWKVVAAADISVSALAPGLEGLAVPSKTYSILAAGRALMAMMQRNAEPARIVEAYQCGWIAESAQEALEVLNQAVQDKEGLNRRGANARKAYEDHFSLYRGVEEYWRVFQEIVSDNANVHLAVAPSPCSDRVRSLCE